MVEISTNKILGVILASYIILKPFYFWSSGNPQVSDFVMVIFLIIAIFKLKILKREFYKFEKILIISFSLLIYTSIVNLIWSAILGDLLIFPILFYMYNITVFIVLVFVVYKYPGFFLKVVYMSIMSSIFIQFILSFFVNVGGTRATIFFNNPNQLGYFVLLSVSIVFSIFRTQKNRPIVLLLFIISSFYLILLSLSQAAIASFLILIILFSLLERHKKTIKSVYLITLSTTSYFIYIIFSNPVLIYGKFEIIDKLISRINSSSERNDGGGLSGRGYDRIVNHPDYWIFGAGEGLHSRFNSVLKLELHSIPGTIFFSYGIIGSSLFLLLIFLIVNKSRIIYSYTLIPILIYGLTHNGLRNSLLWFCLSMLVVVGQLRREVTKRQL